MKKNGRGREQLTKTLHNIFEKSFLGMDRRMSWQNTHILNMKFIPNTYYKSNALIRAVQNYFCSIGNPRSVSMLIYKLKQLGEILRRYSKPLRDRKLEQQVQRSPSQRPLLTHYQSRPFAVSNNDILEFEVII